MTLDTAAIRRRFEQAIIGIRVDGSMAVLIEGRDGFWFDLVTGRDCTVLSSFKTLIRPGDRVEAQVYPNNGWFSAKFRGFSGDWNHPFAAVPESGVWSVWKHIRPLPAPEAEREPDPELAEKCVKLVREMAQQPDCMTLERIKEYVQTAAALFPQK